MVMTKLFSRLVLERSWSARTPEDAKRKTSISGGIKSCNSRQLGFILLSRLELFRSDDSIGFHAIL